MEGLHLRYSSKNLKTIDDAEEVQDPFLIPSDYVWISEEGKKMRIQENRRADARMED